MQRPCGFTFWLARFLLSDFSVFKREGFRVTGQGLSALPVIMGEFLCKSSDNILSSGEGFHTLWNVYR
jgi:hypothetical protein